jgi:hypothetical protein
MFPARPPEKALSELIRTEKLIIPVEKIYRYDIF